MKVIRTLGLCTPLLACSSGSETNPFGDGGETEADSTRGAATEETALPGSSSSEAGSGGDGPKLDVGAGPGGTSTCQDALSGPSGVGCEFYPLALPRFPLDPPYDHTGFSVSNVSDAMATVTLSDRDGVVETREVAPGDTSMFVVGPQRLLGVSTAIVDAGYSITSDRPLQVYQFMPPAPVISADASIVLPANALGTRHRVATYPHPIAGSVDPASSNPTGHYVTVVASDDQTEVTFTLVHPESTTKGGAGVDALDYDAGASSTTVVLDRLEALHIAARSWGNAQPQTNDLTGALVESDRPVAVYAGSPHVFVPKDYTGSLPFACCADSIATAVPPTAVWGSDYAAVKYVPLGNAPDVWRFIADQDATAIELSGDVEDVVILDAGEFHDVETAGSFWASADRAFGLVHLMVGSDLVHGLQVGPGLEMHDCEPISTPGDPTLSWMFPRGNWLDHYVFPVGPIAEGLPPADPFNPKWCNDHVNIVAPLGEWDSIVLDGEPLPASSPLADSGYGYARIPVTAPSYELSAPAGVGVSIEVYGYVDDGSYAYPGGMGLAPINPAG